MVGSSICALRLLLYFILFPLHCASGCIIYSVHIWRTNNQIRRESNTYADAHIMCIYRGKLRSGKRMRMKIIEIVRMQSWNVAFSCEFMFGGNNSLDGELQLSCLFQSNLFNENGFTFVMELFRYSVIRGTVVEFSMKNQFQTCTSLSLAMQVLACGASKPKPILIHTQEKRQAKGIHSSRNRTSRIRVCRSENNGLCGEIPRYPVIA